MAYLTGLATRRNDGDAWIAVFRRALAAVALSLCLVGAARAEPAVRAHVVIDRAIIQLGDLFAGIEDQSLAILPVMNAPAPGQRTQFDQASLTTLARDNGLDWTPSGRGERAVVERAARIVERGALIQALAGALQANGVTPGGAVEYAFEGEDPRIAVSPADPATVRIDQFTFDARSQHFVAIALAPAEGEPKTRVRVAGRLVAAVEVPLTNRDLQTGEIIRARDLEIHRMRADRVNSSVVANADRLIGRTVKRPITAGQMVHVSDVTATLLVTKNNQVHVQLVSGSMIIVLQAKALEDGADGDTVRVLNQQSNRTIQGVVTGPGVVTINAGNAFVAN